MSEPTTNPPPLKKFTKYTCPADTGGLGHSSVWTGALLAGQRPRDAYCMCGEQFVEETDDGSRWRLAWEMDTGNGWHPVEKETASEHDARSQAAGLLALAAEGELVRDVRLERAAVWWEPVDLPAPASTGGAG